MLLLWSRGPTSGIGALLLVLTVLLAAGVEVAYAGTETALGFAGRALDSGCKVALTATVAAGNLGCRASSLYMVPCTTLAQVSWC